MTSEQVNRFQGKYDDKDFSFDYVIKIMKFVDSIIMGQLVKFFRLWKKGQFMQPCIKTKEGTVVKETIVKINLDTNEIIKLFK